MSEAPAAFDLVGALSERSPAWRDAFTEGDSVELWGPHLRLPNEIRPRGRDYFGWFYRVFPDGSFVKTTPIEMHHTTINHKSVPPSRIEQGATDDRGMAERVY